MRLAYLKHFYILPPEKYCEGLGVCLCSLGKVIQDDLLSLFEISFMGGVLMKLLFKLNCHSTVAVSSSA